MIALPDVNTLGALAGPITSTTRRRAPVAGAIGKMRRWGVCSLLVAFAALLLSGAIVWACGASEPEEQACGAMVATGKYNEAPMLAKLVAAGDLPPVDDRLPEVPKVHHLIESVGRYGGELRAFAVTEVVDDFTIRLHSPDGLGDIPLILSAWRGGFRMVFTPSQYMKQFHIHHQSYADKTAAENGFA